MSFSEYIGNLGKLINKLEDSQGDTLSTIASCCADSIEKKRWVHVFGSGHSSLAAMEAFPRIGSFLGFHPIVEGILARPDKIIGDSNFMHATFLERNEEYAEVLLLEYDISKQDVVILISHSGVNSLIVQMAKKISEIGATVVAITSKDCYISYEPRHSSGKKLIDFATYTVDNCCPCKDAIVDIPTLNYPVSATSTIASCIIINGLIAETARILVNRGNTPLILPNHNAIADSDPQIDDIETKIMLEFRKRMNQNLNIP